MANCQSKKTRHIKTHRPGKRRSLGDNLHTGRNIENLIKIQGMSLVKSYFFCIFVSITTNIQYLGKTE